MPLNHEKEQIIRPYDISCIYNIFCRIQDLITDRLCDFFKRVFYEASGKSLSIPWKVTSLISGLKLNIASKEYKVYPISLVEQCRGHTISFAYSIISRHGGGSLRTRMLILPWCFTKIKMNDFVSRKNNAHMLGGVLAPLNNIRLPRWTCSLTKYGKAQWGRVHILYDILYVT